MNAPAGDLPEPTQAGPHPEQVWGDALWVQALLAIDPHGLGGVAVRAGAGPVRDRWLAGFRALLPADMPQRRLPGHIADDRLLGGLDLSATLATGKPVAQRGLLAETHGGVVLVPMAERMSTANAGRLAAALDSGTVGFERDGISARWPAQFGVLACDEGGEDDHPLAPPLLDRLAFRIDLRALSLRDCGPSETRAADAAEVQAARTLLPRVAIDERVLQALCGTAMQFGVDGLRASQQAVRAARAAAALAGRARVNDDDALLAARLVLAPRATRLPTTPDDTPEDKTPPEPPPPDESETPPPAEEPQPQSEPQTLEDRLVEATVAALPAGLLAALQGQLGGDQGGRVGALTATPRSGRPVGTRLGAPKGGARLNLIETLRAAAPWQALRRRAAPQRSGLIHVHSDDLRISRLQQRAATATIFVLDASGSSALHRLGEAKGAVNLLLADCYVRRDQVAVIAFRGRSAELLLPPTRSLVRAKRALAALPGGGGTPLALGLEAALRLALQVRRSGATPIVVLLTDGRANITRAGEPGRAQADADAIAMARQLRAARLTALVVDTSPQPAIAAQRLAAEMAAQYRALPHAGAQALTAAVKSLPRKVN
ncbi:MAG: magnesium chelatase subunit D [Rubrivivax sp.]|nr:magnesium chelatase subunit D [Rubrivivax sp.]